MTFLLADPIAYQPWYFVGLFYLCAVFVFYLAIALCSFTIARLKDNDDKGYIHIGMSISMLYGLLAFFVAYLGILGALVIKYRHLRESYKEWLDVRTQVSLATIILGFGCFILAFVLFYATVKVKYRVDNALIVKKGKTLATHVQAWLVIVPAAAAYEIGPSYGIQKHFLSVLFLSSLICLICSWVMKGKVASSALRMASLSLISTVAFYAICQPLIVSIQMPMAQSYCCKLADELEKHKEACRTYPDKLPAHILPGIHMPHLVKQASIAFYSYNKENTAYSFHIYQDPWVSFSYSSDTKQWRAWKSNLWY